MTPIFTVVLSVSLAFVFLVCSGSAANAQTLKPVSLRCEYLIDPLGIGVTSPRLSWVLESPRQTDRQSACRLLVASSADLLANNQGDLWDTGKIETEQSSQVVYSGKTLVSRMQCFWKVQVWSALGGEPQWSDPAIWTMGLLNAGDWNAKWIDSHDATAERQATKPIRILRAVYGTVATSTQPADAASVDVTEKLKGLAQDGNVSLIVNNETMGKDPLYNSHKHLTVEYEFDGKSIKTIVAEGKTLAIPVDSEPVWCMRKPFVAKGTIKQAVLYVTALGLYEVHINGRRVGDHMLAPDWTDYNKRIRYQAYDVTTMVTSGQNAIAGLIAYGWYAGHLGNGGLHQYGKAPALLGQLEITYVDGSTEHIVTDETWKTHISPILSSDFMLGESYDARNAISGWDMPGTMDSGWAAASVREEAARPLESQVTPPVRVTVEIKPIKLSEPANGRWTYDLGQNMVGVVRLKVNAPAGTVVTLHHAEMLNPDGTIYTTNLRGAPSVDTYICNGGGDEIWQPQFTFHGFRYVELSGLPDKPGMNAVTGVVLGSDTPRTGSFICSDPRVNQLMSNIEWGQRGNYLSVPTDCPQRDERLGWMGDAQVFVRTATCNADVAAFFTKWLVDVDDAQSEQGAFTDVSPRRGASEGTPAWADAGVICPWTIYLAYGDTRLLQKHLPAMTKWVEWCKANSNGLIRDAKKGRGADYGDWLSIHADTPKDVIGTAYFAYSTHILAMAYAAVGLQQQADKYQQLFEDIKVAFNQKYVEPDGRIHGDTQCCYAMALKFDLLPDKLYAAAARHLVDDVKAKDWHLSTGFVGVSYLLPTLTATGNVDIAYKLLLQDTFPSWLFSVKHGATTIWERWDGWTPDKGFQDAGMNSFNHYSLGSVGEWLYDTVAGISWDPQHPGYKHIIIRPRPGIGLTSAKGTIGSMFGPVSCEWDLVNSEFSMRISIPPNTSATVYVPLEPGGVVLPFDAQGVTFVRSENGASIYEVGSGKYEFKVGKPK